MSQDSSLTQSGHSVRQALTAYKPASYQYYFASYAVAHARMLFLRSAIRLAESDDAVRQKIDQATYDSMSELAAIPFGE